MAEYELHTWHLVEDSLLELSGSLIQRFVVALLEVCQDRIVDEKIYVLWILVKGPGKQSEMTADTQNSCICLRLDCGAQQFSCGSMGLRTTI